MEPMVTKCCRRQPSVAIGHHRSVSHFTDGCRWENSERTQHQLCWTNVGIRRGANVMLLIGGWLSQRLGWRWANFTTLIQQGSRRRGAGGGGGTCPPLSKVGGGAQVGLCPPTFGQSRSYKVTICSYSMVKNTTFSKFSWLASLALLNKSIFSKLC